MAVLLVRFAISQMDVPTRQSYTMAVVDPDERSAAAGVTGRGPQPGRGGVAAHRRSAVPGRQRSPARRSSSPGRLKIVYDLLLYRRFRAVRPPEESGVAEARSQPRHG